jgi:hypothetical protein
LNDVGSTNVEPFVPSMVDGIMASHEYTNFLSNVITEIRGIVSDFISNQGKTAQDQLVNDQNSHGPLGFHTVDQLGMSRNPHHELSFSTNSNITNESSSGSISFLICTFTILLQYLLLSLVLNCCITYHHFFLRLWTK